MGWFWCTVGAAALLYCGAVRLLAGKMAFAAVSAVGGAFSALLGLGMLRFPGNLVLGWISGIGVLGICILTALEAGILLRARRLSTPAGKPDCTVILGCGLRDGERASRTMLERLEKAFSVWEGEPIILSGGQSEREKYPEAAVMARWLAGKGVPPEKLLQEGRSRNTVQNLRYSRGMIEAEFGRPVGQLRVRIVTNGFHAPRALSIARALGYAKAWAVPARTGGLAAPLYHLRECLSQPVWWMRRWKMKKMERGNGLEDRK